MIVKLIIKDDKGDYAANQVVELHGEGGFMSSGKIVKGKTNSDGQVELETDSGFLEKVIVSGLTVKENWDISGREIIEEHITLEDPEQASSKDGLANALRGKVYWHDGTLAFREIKIEIEVTTAEDQNRYSVYSKEDGSFFLRLPYKADVTWFREIKVFANGDKIDFKRMHWKGINYLVIILPEGFSGGKGDRGGVITGTVVDKNGTPIEKTKVEITPVTGGLLSFFSANHAETKTNSKGRFALEIEGAVEGKNLRVNGNTPSQITRKRKDGTQVEYNPEVFRVGTFGLNIVAKRSWFQ